MRICVRDCGLGAVTGRTESVVLVEFRHCEVGDEMLRILLKPKIGTACPENNSGRGTTRLELWAALKSPLVECSSERIKILSSKVISPSCAESFQQCVYGKQNKKLTPKKAILMSWPACVLPAPFPAQF